MSLRDKIISKAVKESKASAKAKEQARLDLAIKSVKEKASKDNDKRVSDDDLVDDYISMAEDSASNDEASVDDEAITDTTSKEEVQSIATSNPLAASSTVVINQNLPTRLTTLFNPVKVTTAFCLAIQTLQEIGKTFDWDTVMSPNCKMDLTIFLMDNERAISKIVSEKDKRMIRANAGDWTSLTMAGGLREVLLCLCPDGKDSFEDNVPASAHIRKFNWTNHAMDFNFAGHFTPKVLLLLDNLFESKDATIMNGKDEVLRPTDSKALFASMLEANDSHIKFLHDGVSNIFSRDKSVRRTHFNFKSSFVSVLRDMAETKRKNDLMSKPSAGQRPPKEPYKRGNGESSKGAFKDSGGSSRNKRSYQEGKPSNSSKAKQLCKVCGWNNHKEEDCGNKSHPECNKDMTKSFKESMGHRWASNAWFKLHGNLDRRHLINGAEWSENKRLVLNITPNEHGSLDSINDVSTNDYINVKLYLLQTKDDIGVGKEAISIIDTGGTMGNYVRKYFIDQLCKCNQTNIITESSPSSHTVCNANKQCFNNLTQISLIMTFTDEVSGEPSTHTISAYVLDDCPVDLILGRPTVKQLSLCSRMPSHCFASADASKIIEAARAVKKGLACTCTQCDGNHTKRKSGLSVHLGERISNRQFFSSVDYPTEEDGLLDCADYPFEEPEEAGDIPIPNFPTDIEGSDEQKRILRALCEEFPTIFGRSLKKEPAQWEPMVIDVKKDLYATYHPSNKLRVMSDTNRVEAEAQLQKLLDLGIIVESDCTRYSQIHMVDKKDEHGNKGTGKKRLTIDYRGINAITESLGWPLQRIDDILDRVSYGNPTIFGKLDMTNGYFQAPLDKESRKYTAFRAPSGTYEFTRVAMGLKGAGSYFQRQMASVVLRGLLQHGVEVYIDDIIIHARSEEEFASLTRKVFERLERYNIIVHPDKCHLGLSKVEILGHTIDANGKTFSDEKCKMVADFVKPVFQQQLKSFLGLVNFFRSSLKGLATLVHPLNNLLTAYSPRKVLIWNEEASEAFDKVRTMMRDLPKRFFLTEGLEIVVETDASDYGIGAVMYQLRPEADGTVTKLPIEFISKALTPTQYRWNTTEKECYAIVFALKKWEKILIDKPFTLWSDHENLSYINDSGSSKVLRWKMFLLEFDFIIKYIKGEENLVADCLSRCVEMHDELLSPISAIAATKSWENSKDALLKKEIVLAAVMALTDFNDHREAISQELREAFDTVHNDVAGHKMINATMEKLKKAKLKVSERWSIVKAKFSQLIAECKTCQVLNRKRIEANTLPFVINSTLPMQKLCIDTIGPLPVDEKGFKHILVIVDSFSRWVELYPMKSTEAKESAGHLLDFFMRFQVPNHIVTDNGPEFMNSIIDQLYELSGITRLKTIPYSSQENGLVERLNREVNRHAEAFCVKGDNKKRWSNYLPFIRRIINGSTHSALGTSPASIIYGDRIDLDWVFAPREFREEETNGRTLQEFIKESMAIQDEIIKKAVIIQTELNEENLLKRSNKRAKIPFKKFAIGDWVLMESREHAHGGKRPKLQTARLGPFKVIDILPNDGYVIKKPGKHTRQKEVRVDQLKEFLYDKNTTDPEELAIADEEDLYIVEAIEAFKGTPGSKGCRFLVRWKDYPDDKDKTWQSFEDFNSNGSVNTVFQQWLEQHMLFDNDERWKSYIK